MVKSSHSKGAVVNLRSSVSGEYCCLRTYISLQHREREKGSMVKVFSIRRERRVLW